MTSPAVLPVARSRRVLADLVSTSLIADVLLVLGGAAFVGILAQVSIPLGFTPVPITGQTLGVLLVGSAYGWKRGSLSMVLYVIAGIVGVPWYSEAKHGWTVFSGATGGYLVGFIVAAAVCGWMSERGNDRTVTKSIPEMLVGSAIIYIFGVSWLAHSIGVGYVKAMDLGMNPFVLGDLIKLVLAALILPGAWWLVDNMKKDNA